MFTSVRFLFHFVCHGILLESLGGGVPLRFKFTVAAPGFKFTVSPVLLLPSPVIPTRSRSVAIVAQATRGQCLAAGARTPCQGPRARAPVVLVGFGG